MGEAIIDEKYAPYCDLEHLVLLTYIGNNTFLCLVCKAAWAVPPHGNTRGKLAPGIAVTRKQPLLSHCISVTHNPQIRKWIVK